MRQDFYFDECGGGGAICCTGIVKYVGFSFSGAFFYRSLLVRQNDGRADEQIVGNQSSGRTQDALSYWPSGCLSDDAFEPLSRSMRQCFPSVLKDRQLRW